LDAPQHSAAEFAAMPPRLTDYELETAARGCRALAHVERESAEKISDPALRHQARSGRSAPRRVAVLPFVNMSGDKDR
jgi:hypothetical protein